MSVVISPITMPIMDSKLVEEGESEGSPTTEANVASFEIVVAENIVDDTGLGAHWMCQAWLGPTKPILSLNISWMIKRLSSVSLIRI